MSGYRLIEPYGRVLRNLLVAPVRAAQIVKESVGWPSWDLDHLQVGTLELLLNGSFSPLTGFMCRADYESVCESMRLADETLWPLPVTLGLPEEMARQLVPGVMLALRDPEGFMLAAFHVAEIWQPDGTHLWHVGGRVEGLTLPLHHDFTDLRRTPAELRQEFARQGHADVISFQTTALLHQATYEVLKHASEKYGAALLVSPVEGVGGPGDLEHFTNGRCHRAVLPRFQELSAAFAMVPPVGVGGGLRETLLRAIVARNQGCSHYLERGGYCYADAEARENLEQHLEELGVTLVTYPPVDYREELSTFPELAAELARSHPPRHEQGFAVFLTGLSGAGKSTVASVLVSLFLEQGERPVTLLDGDLVRRYLSSELGFSKEDRDTNIRRIGFVASEITKNGGIAICAPIAPYDAVRKEVRELISRRAGFILVHVATPLEECEARDRKGLYAKARAGIIKGFTGISDPYEEPSDAELVLDTTDLSPLDGALVILRYLTEEGYIR